MIRKYAFIFILHILFLWSAGLSQYKTVGYYPAWLQDTLPAEDIKLEYLSHIIHAFAWPESCGRIRMYDDLYYPELNERVHSANKKILLALGGWGQSEGFPGMTSHHIKRTIFIKRIVKLCKRWRYDGIDINWEFPSNVIEKENLTLFVKELREKFDTINPSWLITMPVSSSNWFGQWFDFDALIEYIDWFSIMAYDFHGGWTDHAGHNAPLYQPNHEQDGSVQTSLYYLNTTRKIPLSKLLLGVPFYGRQFNAANLYESSTDGNTLFTYTEIVSKIDSGWIYYWDNLSKVPYISNSEKTKLITFDDTLSIRLKVEFAKENNLAGLMIWALGQDVIGHNQPLLETLGHTILLKSFMSGNPNQIANNLKLFNNYPNPFNQTTTIEFYSRQDMPVKLSIFNATGNSVAVITNLNSKKGNNKILWNGDTYSSGVYYYQLEVANNIETKKMLMIK
jgi:chitinase